MAPSVASVARVWHVHFRVSRPFPVRINRLIFCSNYFPTKQRRSILHNPSGKKTPEFKFAKVGSMMLIYTGHSFNFWDNRLEEEFSQMHITRVTRFGKLSPLWQKYPSLWQFFDGLFIIWQNAEPTLVHL